MADQLQLRGGTTAEHSTFTGALREVTVDIDKDTVVVHDNTTAGGHPLAKEDLSNVSGADAAATLADQTVEFNLGAAATPSVTFNGDTNTGIYSPGADQVAISTNGAEALKIDANGNILVADGNRMEIDEVRARDGAGLKLFDDGGSGIFVQDGGNVGVGTTSPNAPFEVKKSDLTAGTEVQIFAAAAEATDGSTTTLKVVLTPSASSSVASLIARNAGSGNTSQLSFGTRIAGTEAERMRIDSSGRLLVGTSTSTKSTTLEVSGSISGDTIFTDAATWVQTLGNSSTDAILGPFARDRLVQVAVRAKSGAQSNAPLIAMYLCSANATTTGGYKTVSLGGDTNAFTVTTQAYTNASFFQIRIAATVSPYLYCRARATNLG